MTAPAVRPIGTQLPSCEFDRTLHELERWLLVRDYAGYEPYDLLNSRLLGRWSTHQPFATFFIQSGKHLGGTALRRLLKVAPGRNPKGLGLVLSAYCDLTRAGWNCRPQAEYVKQLLLLARSTACSDYCWGYDWHYVSLRGATLPANSPNSVATVFCAQALLDFAETFHDVESRSAAFSAANWLASNLQRSVDTEDELCLSYTPADQTRIFNNNALVAALLARVDRLRPLSSYRDLVTRSLRFLVHHQAADGSWPYGLGRGQGWIDSFHTAYNLCALHDAMEWTGDNSFLASLQRGYVFYKERFFREDGAPRYFHDRTYPIDIHACSQAILTFCALRHLDTEALPRASQVARFTVAHFRNSDGSFAFQRHRLRTDRTPYLRWSQAWMLFALARLRLVHHELPAPQNLD